jgi:hypothetical protein
VIELACSQSLILRQEEARFSSLICPRNRNRRLTRNPFAAGKTYLRRSHNFKAVGERLARGGLRREPAPCQRHFSPCRLWKRQKVSGDGWRSVLEGEDQVFGVQLELLQTHFLKLLFFRKIGLLNQLFQPLSVALMLLV